MDMINFLASNRMVSGQRWRCLVCEKHLSYYDLQQDGLVKDIIVEFGDQVQPVERDRVEYCADGTYTLLPARKGRNNNKKRQVPDASRSAPGVNRPPPPPRPAAAEPEIILLDDD